MRTYHAENVGLLADTDNGEGWIEFQWPDSLFGWECLRIDLDGHCSRRMPIRSGYGPPDFLQLDRDRIRLRFEASLAGKLELEQEIEIDFSLSDDDFQKLRNIVDYFAGT